MEAKAPKTQLFKPEELIVNPGIRARRGEPRPADVERLANNMLERRNNGQFHQIQPGVVRILDDGTAELIAGDHRRLAQIKLNSSLPDGSAPEDRFEFWAVAVPANDQQALLDALDENEFRKATDVADRGEAWQKLIDLGFKQAEVAARYQVGESTVSETIRVAKLPRKYIDAIKKGKLTEEAAMALARWNKDPKLQEELAELAEQERIAREAIEARAEARAKGEKEPAAATVKDNGKGAPKSDAVKKGGRKTAPGRTTAADVKAAAKKKGVNKREGKSGNSIRDLVKLLASQYGEKVEESVPEPYSELASAIEEYADGLGDRAFLNRWEKCVRTRFASEKPKAEAA